MIILQIFLSLRLRLNINCATVFCFVFFTLYWDVFFYFVTGCSILNHRYAMLNAFTMHCSCTVFNCWLASDPPLVCPGVKLQLLSECAE